MTDLPVPEPGAHAMWSALYRLQERFRKIDKGKYRLVEQKQDSLLFRGSGYGGLRVTK